MLNKSKVTKMYLEGYNASQIARSIGNNKSAVQKWIQRNLKDKKDKHEIAVIERKAALKAVNYEANKYISDRSFILKNRNVYDTAFDGDIVLNRAVSGAVTWDTPRRLVNENKDCY